MLPFTYFTARALVLVWVEARVVSPFAFFYRDIWDIELLKDACEDAGVKQVT